MTTGDLKNNLRKLQTEMKMMKYPEIVDIKGLTQGDAKSFMPIFHYAFTSYSPKLAEDIAAKDIVLFAKSDQAFMDSVYKILRDMFSYKPMVTKANFFSTQFAERKIIMCAEVLQLIQRKCRGSQPTKTSSFRLNSSMDNIAKPPLGRFRPKSATPIPDKKEKDTSNMPPPRPMSSRLSKYRPTANVPTEPKPKVVREVTIDPNQSLDSALSLVTPSIARVKPQSVEVITMQRVQGSSNGPTSAPPTVSGFSDPAGGDVTHINSLISDLNKKLEHSCRLLESVEGRVGRMETLFDKQKATPTPPPSSTVTSSTDAQRMIEMEARIKLLENRVLLLESKAVDKKSITETKNSPVTPGKAGTFVTVETFVNGESKVRKMAREAEAKIRCKSAEDDVDKFSPTVRARMESAAMNKSDEEMFTMIPDPEPVNSSTPNKIPTPDQSISLKCVDTPTQDQAHRIQHLVQTTKSMLSTAQTEIPADEIQRQDVD